MVRDEKVAALILFVILLLLALLCFKVYEEHEACKASGGVLVRGVWSYVCLQPTIRASLR